MWQDILLIIGAYLLGSAPHLVALGRMRGIKMDGDRHILLWSKGGRALGFTGVILDVAKGAIPVLAGRLLHFDIAITTAAGVAVVIGQMWPVFNRFDGEKGNSIGAGMALSLAMKPFLVAAVVFAIGAGIKLLPRLWRNRQTLNEWTRFGGPTSISLPVGMIAGFLVLPFASWGFHEPAAVTVGFAILFILLIIRRITAGLKADLKGKRNTGSIIINRMLLDRSFR
jgi:acyl phosphate:glycerol-3-phosphate acyltransferase